MPRGGENFKPQIFPPFLTTNLPAISNHKYQLPRGGLTQQQKSAFPQIEMKWILIDFKCELYNSVGQPPKRATLDLCRQHSHDKIPPQLSPLDDERLKCGGI